MTGPEQRNGAELGVVQRNCDGRYALLRRLLRSSREPENSGEATDAKPVAVFWKCFSIKFGD